VELLSSALREMVVYVCYSVGGLRRRVKNVYSNVVDFEREMYKSSLVNWKILKRNGVKCLREYRRSWEERCQMSVAIWEF
jgi:hypothetical protein